MEEFYLGDGVYASFDGSQIKLRAPREHGDHEVYLERAVMISLVQFVKMHTQWHLRSLFGNP